MMTRCTVSVMSSILGVVGFIAVAVGFSTRYWFFTEKSRWQFKCDMRVCCVRDIDPVTKFWTCWPIKDTPKLYRLGLVITCAGLVLWLPAVICYLVARARVYRPKKINIAGSCFVMLAGILGVSGCHILFSTAREDFIIAEVPGISGYLVQIGSALGLGAAVLDLALILFKCVQRLLALTGTVLGCVAALLWILLRPLLRHVTPFVQRVTPKLIKTATRRWTKLRSWNRRLWISISSNFRTCRPYMAPIVAIIRPRIFASLALVVLCFSAVLTFLETKLATLLTFSFTKLAAVLILLSPRLSEMITSAKSFIEDQRSKSDSFSRLVFHVASHVFFVVLAYLERLIRPSFESTLAFVMAKLYAPKRVKFSKAVALQSVTII